MKCYAKKQMFQSSSAEKSTVNEDFISVLSLIHIIFCCQTLAFLSRLNRDNFKKSFFGEHIAFKLIGRKIKKEYVTRDVISGNFNSKPKITC